MFGFIVLMHKSPYYDKNKTNTFLYKMNEFQTFNLIFFSAKFDAIVVSFKDIPKIELYNRNSVSLFALLLLLLVRK